MSIDRFEIQPGYTISRIVKGGWHLAGGHGAIDKEAAIADMLAFVESGITTFDCADIYTGVEALIGEFLRKYRTSFSRGSLPAVQIHTKYVPDYDALSSLRKEDTEAVIDRSLKRLGTERLDLVQFAWWDYQVPGYVETAMHLQEMQQAGKIRYIGVTNFDGQRLGEILDAGVPVVANQVQYSILDHRVERDLNALGAEYDITYLCYGVLAGGFLSDQYLGKEDPKPPLENRSLVKYRLIIDEFGGYQLFRQALEVMRTIADQYGVGIAEVAARYILQKPMVGGVIIGVRNRRHLAAMQRMENFELSENDLEKLRKIREQAKGPLGPFYALERDKTGKHGAIMKYNLNEQRS